MDHISTKLAQIQRNIEIVGADNATRLGFTQVPNFILVSRELSVGAKLVYAMLLKYAWQDDFCFPGQEKLAQDMGVSDRSTRTYINELEAAGYLDVVQRGLGKTNLYKLYVTTKQKPKQQAFRS